MYYFILVENTQELRHLEDLGVNVMILLQYILRKEPVPMASRSKTYIYGRSPAETVGSNPTVGMDFCLL